MTKQENKPKKKFSFFRFIFKALLWLILLIIFCVVCLYYYLGTIVREAINRYVPPITGTTTSVERVDLSLFSGNIEIDNLKIGNPKGFSDKDIFALGKVHVKFTPKSLLTDKIIINSVLISGTKVSAELKNLYSLDSNISALQKNVNNYLGIKPSDKKDEPKKEASQEKSQTQKSAGKQVIIKDLKINDTELSLGVSGQTITLPLPNIHKTGIGEEKKPKTIGEVFADILNLISVESVNGVSAATDLAKKGIKGAKDLISSGANSLKDGAKNISDSTKNTVKGLKELFK